MGYWNSIVLFTTLYCFQSEIVRSSEAFAKDEDLQPPHSVRVVADAERSLTLSWDGPEDKRASRKISKYSIHYFSQFEEEKEIEVSPPKLSQMITGLTPGTNYTIYVTVHYRGNKRVSSPKFIVPTLQDPTLFIYRDCSCYETGTQSCNKLPSGGQCVCKIGYEGPECDVCSEGFYRAGRVCLPCPCSTESSIGNCELGTSKPGEVICTCKQGYFGRLCDSCVLAFYPVEDWCVPCQCLFCHNNHTHKQCQNCPSYSHNYTDHNAVLHNCGLSVHPRSQQRKRDHGDGTVAIVAVLCSLSFIGCVAGAITCYRRRMQSRNQAPFWSIELAEDKVSLNSGSDYRRLDGSSKESRSGHRRSPSVAEATASQRVADQPQYNCISI